MDDTTPATAPRPTCPECGYAYPLGSIATATGILDPIVESGGHSEHPSHCRRSEAPVRSNAGGLYQQIPGTWPRTTHGR